MEPTFCYLGPAFLDLVRAATPARPASSPAPAEPASHWAESRLQFKPSAKQAEVLDTDARYLALCCNRQWGKTTTIAVKALHRAVTEANQTIVIIARTKLQAGILIQRACQFALRLGHRIRRVLGHQFSLQLPNGSNIFAVPHTSDTSLGSTAHVLIVDEAALVKDEVYFSVSPFIGRTHGSIWLMSTPRRQAGFFYNVWHGNDDRWTRVFSTVADCPEIDPDFLEMQRQNNEIKYKQDFECQFIQPADRWFSRDLLDSLHS